MSVPRVAQSRAEACLVNLINLRFNYGYTFLNNLFLQLPSPLSPLLPLLNSTMFDQINSQKPSMYFKGKCFYLLAEKYN